MTVVILVLASAVGCAGSPPARLDPARTADVSAELRAATLRPSPAAASTAGPSADVPAAVECDQFVPASSEGASGTNEARPAVAATLDLFDSFPIVAIGEYHGSSAQHDFLAQLICDPRFPETVDAIVVEFANRRLQGILDRYIGGENVTAVELASVWRSSTQTSGVWEHPVYERFFSLVRSVNQTVPEEQRIRVLAGDPPIDRSTVTEFGECNSELPTCHDYWLQRRDASFAEVVATEVLEAGHNALLVAGAGHMTRQLNPEHPPDIPAILEAEWPGSTFVMIPHTGFAVDPPNMDIRERLSSWPVPGLAVLGDMWLGDLDACLLEGPESPDAPPCPDAGGPTLSDLADGYLYLGDR